MRVYQEVQLEFGKVEYEDRICPGTPINMFKRYYRPLIDSVYLILYFQDYTLE